MTETVVGRQQELIDAQQVIADDRQRRADDCMVELQKLLGHYRCELVPVVTLTFDGRAPTCAVSIRAS